MPGMTLPNLDTVGQEQDRALGSLISIQVWEEGGNLASRCLTPNPWEQLANEGPIEGLELVAIGRSRVTAPCASKMMPL